MIAMVEHNPWRPVGDQLEGEKASIGIQQIFDALGTAMEGSGGRHEDIAADGPAIPVSVAAGERVTQSFSDIVRSGVS